jgi:D-amino-acid dehydrogenase
MSRIIVVGGGVIGLCSALALVRAGHDVVVVDGSHGREAASWGNAGHIAVEQVAPLASWATLRGAPARRFAAGGALDMPIWQVGAWLPFAARFVAAARTRRFDAGRAALGTLLGEAMPAWRRAMLAQDGPSLLRDDGHYVVWNDRAAAERQRAAWHAADTGCATVHDADAADLARIAAITAAPVAGAIRFAGSGQIADLAALAERLERELVRAGGTIVRECAALHLAGGTAHVAGHAADQVLVAAGVGSRRLLAAVGHCVPMVAERGYHIRAAAGGWPADMPPVVFEDRAMIVTRYADTVQAASFVELADPAAPADPRKWERLERHVRDLGLALHGPFTRWMGGRPTLPDYLPAIGRSARAGNLFYAFGHQHLGLTLAALTAELVTELMNGATPSIDLAPYDLERFRLRRAA